MILSYFSNSDDGTVSIMALRSTCVRLSTLLQRPMTASDILQQKYSNFLRSRKLAAICQLERGGLLPRDELTCAACVRSHASRYFFKGHDEHPPEKRKCIGSTGCLHICNHLSITHEQLWTGGRQFWCGLFHGNPEVHTHDAAPPSFGSRNSEGLYTTHFRRARDEVSLLYYRQTVRKIGPCNVNQRGIFLAPRSVYNEIYGQVDKNLGTYKQKSGYWPKWNREHRRKEGKMAKETNKDEDLILRAEYLVLRSTVDLSYDKMFLPNARIASRVHTTLTSNHWRLSSSHGLCPHIDSKLIAASLQADDNSGLSWGKRLLCPNAQCKTSVRFEIDKKEYPAKAEVAGKYAKIEPLKEILMIVERNLGPGRDVTDDRWVLQLEQCLYLKF